ncbi:MAG TPA: hypothetical protein DEB74_11465 [Lachnospiraceae bacterium]|nr:hypothetical protein [Lachnospiraceae bacterium]
MTWKTYTKAIHEAELESGTQAQILIKLFKRAGCINKKEDDISESTAKKWISGTRNCKVSTYFPARENVKTQDLYNFFINRPPYKLVKLQEEIRSQKDDNSSVDCETKDRDRFCLSLVNQFLDLLGFEREDIPNIANEANDDYIRGHQGGTEKRMSDIGASVCTDKENKRIVEPECMLDILLEVFKLLEYKISWKLIHLNP